MRSPRGGCATIFIMLLVVVAGVVLVVWLWLCVWLLVVSFEHFKALPSRRLRDHLCHVIVVGLFSIWLRLAVVVWLLAVVDEVVVVVVGCL